MKLDFNMNVAALAVVLLLSAAYWAVSLTSPVIFGDEGFYAATGRWLARTGDYPAFDPHMSTPVAFTLLRKEPVWIMMNSGLWLIGQEMALRAIFPFVSGLAGLLLYLLLRNFGQPLAGLVAAASLMMMPGFVTYGVLDYVEIFNIVLIMLAANLALWASKGHALGRWALVGAICGLAALTDATGSIAIVLAGLIALVQRAPRISLAALVVAGLLVMTPWLARNMILYGGTCIQSVPIGSCEQKVADNFIASEIKVDSGLVPVGTQVSISKMGWLSYLDFAIGLPAFILLVFGTLTLRGAGRARTVLGIWLVLFVLLTVQQAYWGGRAEDIPRYTLFGFPAIAAAIGGFAASAHMFLGRYNRWLALAAVVLMLVMLWPTASEKLNTMKQVKAFAPGFFVGCNWVRANLPADVRIFCLYQHHMSYLCDRRGFSNGEVPDGQDIQFTNNDTSWQHLRQHATDYVFVPQFTVNQQAYSDATSVAWLNYMETSPHFKKVYDNTAQYGTSGVRIYKVLA
jgi:4-amino-4-deoxy-L-arabinose transferase-like glycosyltransferase